MKAIQYKRPDDNSNIDDGALQKAFGGQIEYIGGSWCRSRVAILRANGQEIYIRYGDWILEKEGLLILLTNEEYQLLQSEQRLKEIKDRIDGEVKQHQHRVRVGIVKPQSEPPKDLGQMIGNAVRTVIRQEQRQGGLLTTESKDNAPDVSSTTIEDCRKRFKGDIRNISINIEWPKL